MIVDPFAAWMQSIATTDCVNQLPQVVQGGHVVGSFGLQNGRSRRTTLPRGTTTRWAPILTPRFLGPGPFPMISILPIAVCHRDDFATRLL
jgi:hypothetical protein